jgi:hypothetical protein
MERPGSRTLWSWNPRRPSRGSSLPLAISKVKAAVAENLRVLKRLLEG